MNVVDITVKSLLSVFPDNWPERLKGLHYSEAKLAELKPRFEENWIRQTNLHLNLEETQLCALIQLAQDLWSDETLRLFSLMTSHFLFNAGNGELHNFSWPTADLHNTGLQNSKLFYLLAYLTHIDAAIQVYREQRIPLDLYAQTANRLKFGITETLEGGYAFNDYAYLCWLCEGKVINLNGLCFLPARWEDPYSIWRNGLNGDLHEEIIENGQFADQISLAKAAKERGLDLNLWQLKLKPQDKILKVLEVREALSEAEISHVLGLADRFYKDADHFHNFVAYDFRACRNEDENWNQTVVLREEL